MNYRIKMTAEQARAVAEWAARGDGFADVLLDDGDDDRIVVGQGDERAAFNVDGALCCERCGALDGEELQGGCCYSCGTGCEAEDTPHSTDAGYEERILDAATAAAEPDDHGYTDREIASMKLGIDG